MAVTTAAVSTPVATASASARGWRRTIWRMASASDSSSSANSAMGRTVSSTACGIDLLTSTMLVSRPFAVALATMPRPPTTTMRMMQARQRSRSAGLRIRCSRWSSTRTGGGRGDADVCTGRRARPAAG